MSETLEKQKAELASDIRDVFAQAKSAGIDVPAPRSIIKMRKQDAAERAVKQVIIDSYLAAL